MLRHITLMRAKNLSNTYIGSSHSTTGTTRPSPSNGRLHEIVQNGPRSRRLTPGRARQKIRSIVCICTYTSWALRAARLHLTLRHRKR